MSERQPNGRARRRDRREKERARASLLPAHMLEHPRQNQEQEHAAGRDAQPANGPAPKDYPLVPLASEIKSLTEAYTAAQKENTIQQAKQLNVQRLLCLFTFSGFAAAAIYALIAAGQWRDLSANFQLSEKARISTGPVGVSFVQARNRLLSYRLKILAIYHL
jgi:hypothetical protein